MIMHWLASADIKPKQSSRWFLNQSTCCFSCGLIEMDLVSLEKAFYPSILTYKYFVLMQS